MTSASSTQLLDLARENERLKQALDESVKLQSHYAEALNMYDGGRRIVFRDAAEWMARLAMTTKERVEDAARREELDG